ncbi:osmoprotectant transport system substrate-binding protein [Bacilli bacterium PM5-3]|nr:osmoprotectant transport system substrate-binding protein [Bacilli bacterium PM5-3]MDH6603348.1 osmoprotectant transport system substrate-binding protein [Bacilli bacterium PM5-9]
MFKKILSAATVICLCFTLVACGGSSSKSDKEMTLLKGQYSEITIIMEMAKILIEENTDIKVNYQDSMNTVAAAKTVENGDVDLYVSYDGTLLSTILQSDPSEVPKNESLFDYTNKLAKEKKKIELLSKFGFENTYAMAIKEDFAKKNNIKTISDLTKYSKDLVFGAEHEFFDEEGSVRFKPVNSAYGLEWKDSKSLDIGLKYSSIDSGNIDATVVYSTDGLNKKSDLRILVDDKGFFPEYNAGFLMRESLFEEYKETAPKLKEILSKLDNAITNEQMIEMNYQVDANKKDIHEVANQFLIDNNLK